MGFSDYKYERPQIEQIEEKFNHLLSKFSAAQSYTEQNEILKAITEIRNSLSTMTNLVYIRHSIDTNDTFYKEEQDYLDQIEPRLQRLTNAFYKVIVASPFRQELEAEWGQQLFVLADLTLKTFSPDVMDDLQKENALSSRYRALIASAEIDFDGRIRNLSEMGPFLESADRDVRKRAVAAYVSFFESHSEELDDIYDQLVKVRTNIAKKLGYQDFVELGYLRMQRSDYNRDMVKNFRDQVRDLIVPVATKIRQQQQKRIQVDQLKYYDEAFFFPSGNPKPHGNPEWIIDGGSKMYQQLSSDTNEFYQFMRDNELLDLVAHKGKAAGGFCTNLADYKAPFIFSNFNGTLGDVTVLTHEAGHAFQTYMSRNWATPEYAFPTSESAEIHSMSMEFFTWPWMNLFFEEETDKFKYLHLSEALLFIPYGVAVDEFQHFVYENPEATPAERKAAWRRIEKTYLPHRDYEGFEYLEDGGYWQRQAHIYEVPFYYIDYTLAQICAFQFWARSEENFDSAWADYLEICRVGGSKSFLDIVKDANLISPFEDGCVASVINKIETWLAEIDDSKF